MSILLSSLFATGSSADQITGYTQTAVMQASQTVSVPTGTKRIEALLCGGGFGGNGFGVFRF